MCINVFVDGILNTFHTLDSFGCQTEKNNSLLMFLMFLSGTTGARRGEHSAALPGSVLPEEQAVRRGVALRSALLRLQ